MQVNNSQPSFGMAVRIPNKKIFNRKELDAITMAMPELKEIGKDVELVINKRQTGNGQSFLQVATNKTKSYIQRLLSKQSNANLKESNMNTATFQNNKDSFLNHDAKEISQDLITLAQKSKKDYLNKKLEASNLQRV